MQSTRLSYSRTSWKLDSQKSIGRTVHRGPCTPTESAASNTQAQKADHYILCVRIKMRSGAYATPRQDTDYAGAGGGQEFLGRPDIRGTICLTWMFVQAILRPAAWC
jgi:hypothetical protein